MLTALLFETSFNYGLTAQLKMRSSSIRPDQIVPATKSLPRHKINSDRIYFNNIHIVAFLG